MSASGHYDSDDHPAHIYTQASDSPTFFDDAFNSAATPPANSYLDSVLNPQPAAAQTQTQTQAQPQAYVQPDEIFGYPVQPYPSSTIVFDVGLQQHTMPSSHHAPGRPSRLPNGFSNLVDLTAESPEDMRRSARRERTSSSPVPGPSQKRQKQTDGTPANVPSKPSDAQIEEIDLSNNDTMQQVLSKQRQDAVKPLKKPVETATTFNNFTCVICMDTPTDLTATACGHLFCHTCLMEALIAGENRSAPGDPRRSQCPVCRKVISRTKGSDIIPLLLKKGLATQPRRKMTPKVT